MTVPTDRIAGTLSRRGLLGSAAAAVLLKASPAWARAAADAPAAVAPATLPVPATTSAATRPYMTWFNPPKVQSPLLSHHGYDSASMRTRVGYNLYLPPGYADAASAGKRYPVLYWLHGLSHNESSDLFPVKLLDWAVKAGTIPPVIGVYANGGSDGWYADSPDGKWMAQTTIIKELIPHVDATYRTVADRAGRAVHGMSMGGGGAVKFAVKYPELFSSVVAYAPSFRTPAEMALEPRQAKAFETMFGGDADRMMADHPFTMLKKNVERVRGKVGIKFMIGTADKPVLLGGCRTFHAMLDKLKVPHEYAEVPGVTHNLGGLVAVAKTDGLAFAAKHFG
jgi:S-formylglutathione hydrolase FrmB